MKKLKFILVVMIGLGFSLEAFSAEGVDVDLQEAVELGLDMSSFDSEEKAATAEVDREEEMGIDISSEDIESTLVDAYASR